MQSPDNIHIILFSSLMNARNLLDRLRTSSKGIQYGYRIVPLRQVYKMFIDSVIWYPPSDPIQAYNKLLIKSSLSSKELRRILAQVPIYVISIEKVDFAQYQSYVDSLPVMMRKMGA